MSASQQILSTLFDVQTVPEAVVLRPRAPQFVKEQAQEFDRLVTLLQAEGMVRFVIDLTGCEYISSDGLGIIARWWNEFEQSGRLSMAIALSGSRESEVSNLFDITGLTNSIGSALQCSVGEALNYLHEFVPAPPADIL